MPIRATSKSPRLESLRRKIVVSAGLYTLVALLLISAIGILPLFRHLKASEEEALLHAVRIRTVAVGEFLNRLSDIALQIRSREFIRRTLESHFHGDLTRERLEAMIQENLAALTTISPEIAGVMLLDWEGRPLGEAGLPIPAPYATAPEGAGEVIISDPFVIQGGQYLRVAAPVHARSGERIGTYLIFFTVHKLQRIVWDPSNLMAGTDSLLGQVRQGRAEIFFPGRLGEREVYNLMMEDSLYFRAMARAVRGESGLIRSAMRGRGPDIAAYAPVAGKDWGMLITTEQEELYAGVNALLFSVAGGVLFLALCGAAGMSLLLRPLTEKTLAYYAEMERLNRDLQQEIEERRRAEESVRRSEREWAQTFDAITDAVAILAIDGNILKMNRANLSFLGSLSGDLVSGGPFAQMKATRAPAHGQLYLPQQDRHYHISIYPLLTAEGILWGGVHIAQDITEQKKMESLKDEMISSVSHEMRTPLTAMLGFIEFMLENEVEPAQQREFLETVHRETERLNELVSNFLDLQRLQAQLESYRFEPLPVCPLLREMVQFYAVASKRHTVGLECAADLPPVRGDARRLQQVLKNLLTNAIRYSPEGGAITVGARQEGDVVRFWVRDEGMGIPPQAMNRIFERFYRVDDSSRRIPGGIGLGLALVREVIRAHQGRVWVESTLGKGSTFYFTVPVYGAGMADEEPAAPSG